MISAHPYKSSLLGFSTLICNILVVCSGLGKNYQRELFDMGSFSKHDGNDTCGSDEPPPYSSLPVHVERLPFKPEQKVC